MVGHAAAAAFPPGTAKTRLAPRVRHCPLGPILRVRMLKPVSHAGFIG
jgi:hypothetical protein